MKNIAQKTNSSGGYALFSVMLVLLTASVLLGVVLSSSKQRIFMARRLADRTRALAIAETGICQAYDVLATNFNARTNAAAFPSRAFAGGSYALTITAANQNTALVKSRGVFNGIAVEPRVDVGYLIQREEVYIPGFECDPFKLLVLSGRDMSWKTKKKAVGQLQAVGGFLHSNKKIKLEGENVEITSDVTASKKIEVKNDPTIIGDMTAPQITFKNAPHVTGAVTIRPVPIIPIPKIDLTPYYNEALANHQVFKGDYKIRRGATVNLAPPGGIMWINGRLMIDGNGTMAGCFIATRGIRIKGTVTHTKVADYPALIAKDRGIELDSDSTYHGLIYAPKGDIKLKRKGTGSLTGCAITGKGFKGEGAWTLMTAEDSTPGYPDQTRFIDESQMVGVTAWHR